MRVRLNNKITTPYDKDKALENCPELYNPLEWIYKKELVKKLHHNELAINEKNYGDYWGMARVDIMTVDSLTCNLGACEIKTSKDSLKRAFYQEEVYSRFFNTVTFIMDKKFKDKMDSFNRKTGLIIVDEYTMEFSILRDAQLRHIEKIPLITWLMANGYPKEWFKSGKKTNRPLNGVDGCREYAHRNVCYDDIRRRVKHCFYTNYGPPRWWKGPGAIYEDKDSQKKSWLWENLRPEDWK